MRNNTDFVPRILFLSPSFEDQGGVVSFTKTLVQHNKGKFSYEHFVIGNIVGNKCFIKRLLNFYRHGLRLRQTLKTNNYDLIHINPTMEIYSIIRDSYYLNTAIKSGYAEKVVVFFHGWNPSLARKIAHNPFLKRRFLHLYQQAGIIFVLSSSFKKQLVELGIKSDKIKISTTFISDTEFSDSLPLTESNKIQILYMSRLVKNKGAKIAAEVGNCLVQNKVLNFKMTIAGNGPEFEGIKKYINDNGLSDYINLPGFVSGHSKVKLLLESDIFLFPSFYNEGCPIVILEAMRAGNAVVSTPVGAIPDVVLNDSNGYILKERTAQPFFEAVSRLINDKELLARMKKNNREKAKQNYVASIVVNNIEADYWNLLKGEV